MFCAKSLGRLIVVLGIGLGCLVAVRAVTAGEPAGAAAKLARIAWIQGAWKAGSDGDHLDEFWSPPHGDSMIGSFRWSKKEQLWMSEMLSIVTEGENIVLRVKHFDRSMVGWEEKDKSIVLPLVKQTDDESVFETDPKESKKVTLTYRKTGKDKMDVILDTAEGEKKRHSEFHFTRMEL